MTFQLAFKCYQCGHDNHIQVDPVNQIASDEQDTVTLHYADHIPAVCPHCGQKYAIPNSQQKRVISSTRRNPNF